MAGKYPDRIKRLALYDGRFDAHKLEGRECDVLFASYAAGTKISAHSHSTDNHGIITRGELILILADKETRIGVGQWYHVPANVEHAARFDIETDEIEFWFENA